VNTSNYKIKVVKGKSMTAHRAVMEKCLGRKLDKSEVVHHINGDKSDNSIWNLMITTHAEHAKMHSKDRRKSGKKKKRFSVYIEPNSLNSLKEIDERPAAEHIRIAIEDYLDKIINRYATTSKSKIKKK